MSQLVPQCPRRVVTFSSPVWGLLSNLDVGVPGRAPDQAADLRLIARFSPQDGLSHALRRGFDRTTSPLKPPVE